MKILKALYVEAIQFFVLMNLKALLKGIMQTLTVCEERAFHMLPVSVTHLLLNMTIKYSIIQNFIALGIREYNMLSYVREHVNVRVERTIDPTLLVEASLYESIIAEPQMRGKYILLYSRRYNIKMEQYAERMSKEMGLPLVEISIRAKNIEKGHIMRYDAGVEEFLSLVKNAECVITNSFHGVIFAVQLRTPFYCFSREQGDTKIREILDLFGLRSRILINGTEAVSDYIDFEDVHTSISEARESSKEYLKYALELL